MEKKLENGKSLINKYKNDSVLLFTGDKESTVLLEFTRGLNLPVIFVDTGLYLKAIYEYLKLAEEYWGFQARILRDEKVIEESKASGKEGCYNLLKEKIVLPYLRKQGVSSLIEPIKSERNITKKEGVVSIFPLSGFSDLEIWIYIRKMESPYCDLYNKGYKNVGCEPCSRSKTRKEMDSKEISRRLKSLGYF